MRSQTVYKGSPGETRLRKSEGLIDRQHGAFTGTLQVREDRGQKHIQFEANRGVSATGTNIQLSELKSINIFDHSVASTNGRPPVNAQ